MTLKAGSVGIFQQSEANQVLFGHPLYFYGNG
jgi:hypothetical protein